MNPITEATQKRVVKSQVLVVSLVILVFLCPLSITQAQVVTATLTGAVKDPSDSVLPGVRVTATNAATNLSRETITDQTGTYTFPNLNPGEYKIEAELSGFKKAVLSGIVLQVAQRARMDIALEVGELTETVTVESAAPIVDTESPTIGSVVDERRVGELPLNGRNFMELTTLTGGMNEGNASTNKSVRGYGPSAAGMPAVENSYQLDGVDNREMYFHSFNVVPSVDAIREFRIQVGQYSAEFGAGGGAVINVVTRSGTNEFHGTTFEFIRNNVFDARNFFSQGKPPLRRNQFGFSAGGPIIKNRSFIFGNYDGTRERKGLTFAQNVPTAAQRAGDLSGFNKTILDPLTGQPFPGAVIPGDRIDPISRKILDFYPTPNSAVDPLRNFTGNPSLKNDQDSFLTKVDHHLSPKNDLMGRYAYQYVDFFNPGPFGRVGGLAQPQRFQNAAIGLTSSLTPSFLNELRFAYGRNRYDYAAQNVGKPIGQELGLAFAGQTDFMKGFISAANLGRTVISGIGEPQSWLLLSDSLQWYEGVTWTRGKHTIKAGADIKRIRFSGKDATHANGNYTFSGQFTGDGFADFLLGFPSSMVVPVTPSQDSAYRRTEQAYYVLDDFKVNSKLTLNYGLRYEFLTVPKELNGITVLFDPKLGGGVGGLLFPKQNTRAKEFFTVRRPDLPFGFLDRETPFLADKNNFAPRFGFAYRPFATTRTVIRGGYGWYYSSPQSINFVDNAVVAPPAYQWVTIPADPRVPDLHWNGKQGVAPETFLRGVTYGLLTGIEQQWLNGYTQQWSLSLSQELTRDLVLEAQYLGSKSTHLERAYDNNFTSPSPEPLASRVPFPKWSRIFGFSSGGTANYNAMLLSAEHRFAEGLAFKGAYTFSKTLASGSTRIRSGNIGSAQNPNNLKAEGGLTTDDIRHRLTMNYLYDLPFGPQQRWARGTKGVVAKLIGGWRVAGITTFRTGFPLTPTVNNVNCNSAFANSCRPDLVGSHFGLLDSNGVDTPRFDVNAFDWPRNPSHPAQRPRFGTAAPNILRSNGLNNWDLSLIKNTYLGERYNVEFRFETFNAFNHPNFGNPIAAVDSPLFGRTFSALEARDIQFGLKFYW
jgi:hypothetical protein